MWSHRQGGPRRQPRVAVLWRCGQVVGLEGPLGGPQRALQGTGEPANADSSGGFHRNKRTENERGGCRWMTDEERLVVLQDGPADRVLLRPRTCAPRGSGGWKQVPAEVGAHGDSLPALPMAASSLCPRTEGGRGRASKSSHKGTLHHEGPHRMASWNTLLSSQRLYP